MIVSDTLPLSSYSLLDESTPGAHYDEAQRTVIWRIDSLEPGEGRSPVLNIATYSTIPDGAVIMNRICVPSDQTEPIIATDEASLLALPPRYGRARQQRLRRLRSREPRPGNYANVHVDDQPHAISRQPVYSNRHSHTRLGSSSAAGVEVTVWVGLR